MDKALFRAVMGSYATGIAVATAALADNRRVGLTINSFTSVSLDPPLALFCLDKHALARPIFTEATGFAINILHAGQKDVSVAFAKSGQTDERWQGLISHAGKHTNAPLFEDCLARLECRLVAQHDAGDHVILIGEVVDMLKNEGQPLLYWQSDYRFICS